MLSKAINDMAHFVVTKVFIVAAFAVVSLMADVVLFDGVRDLNGRIKQSAQSSIKSGLASLNSLEFEFIKAQTAGCMSNPIIVRSGIENNWLIAGLTGMNDSEIEVASEYVRNRCLRNYVIDSDSLSDLMARHEQLGNLSPFSNEEIASLTGGKAKQLDA